MPHPGDNLFACISQIRKPDRIQDHMPAHVDWLKERDLEGRVVATGAQLPLGSGGVQIFAAANLEEMEAMLATDPLVAGGVTENWVFEFQLNDEPNRGRLMNYFFDASFSENSK
ncbi:YciI family protein [Ruegeria sp. EL01]|uniref:YciI family protein n=1 Tax=Ruegeria sp. EL01 TaxID=2107578 RepID=UPI001C1FF64F|nr:YciI family protein [Ruegeria sp. EL01]